MNYETVFEEAYNTPGAVSVTELFGLNATILSYLEAREGIAVDLGSHAGRSSMVAAKVLSDKNRKDHFNLVDLVYDLKNGDWGFSILKSADNMPWRYVRDEFFMGNILQKMECHSDLNIRLLGLSSRQFFALNRGKKFSYVFIDSDDHQVDLVLYEAKELENSMLKGGLIFFHDYRNQYRGPSEALEYLISTDKYEEIGISWENAIEETKKSELIHDKFSWHMPGVEFPTYLGCVRRK